MIRTKLLAFLLAGLTLLSAQAAVAAPLKAGVSAGPYGDILKFAADIAAKEGIEVQVIEFTDWTLPNAALAQGDLDFNHFQHRPYLNNQIAQRGWELVAVAPSVLVPFALYANKIDAVEKISDKASIAIPNDPTNGARALQLLEKAKLITLNPSAGQKATLADIADNPKKLKFREIDAAQLPRSLADVDAGVVPLNYALAFGLDPKKSLIGEGADSQWGLWFVTRKDNQDDPRIRRYIEIVRSPETKQFVLDRFDGTIIPTW